MAKPAHPKPCQNCNHQDLHGEVSGCIAVVATKPRTAWCPCDTYVSPRNKAETAREGRQAAAQGMEAAQAGHAMTRTLEGPEWRTKAEARLSALIARGTDFTAEDVTDVVGAAPSPSAIGGLFRGRKADMVAVGFTTATRAEAHGRALRVWKGKA